MVEGIIPKRPKVYEAFQIDIGWYCYDCYEKGDDCDMMWVLCRFIMFHHPYIHHHPPRQPHGDIIAIFEGAFGSFGGLEALWTGTGTKQMSSLENLQMGMFHQYKID